MPAFAYQVIGEYSLHKMAFEQGIIGDEVILESLKCIKRAGAASLTYFAKEAARRLTSNHP
ncbi:hypothetical protein QWI16_13875 [Gilvimarinus sp. SDUM040014]|uniref:Delta-aminolevulinic acid dehydratase n=1 Tax=Gilvimarinus algae TaxID=3058037 RepID=A0ABT8TGY7_9GAMM|nr:hypothetical protein [Gilvimarinus sp. SDUM040014]MDO3383265.1 hypothetical protein [Gilvimarinus sp. SDUM040014]